MWGQMLHAQAQDSVLAHTPFPCLSTEEDLIGRNDQKDQIETDRIFVNPNPAVDRIEITLPQGMSELSITSISGAVLYNKTLSGLSEEIDISTWPPGMYILRLKQAETIVINRLIISR